MSGSSPAISNCLIASSPITVWCSSTWLSTEPSEYFTAGSLAATSTASEIAMPSEPGLSGCSLRMARPESVSVDGDGMQRAP